MAKRTDTASRLIHASASRLYEAFSSPGAMERWLPPGGMTGVMIAFDFREGGSYRMRLSYDEPAQAHGKTAPDADEVEVKIVRLVADRRIEQIAVFDSPDPAFSGEMRLVWTLEPRARDTLVTVTAEDVPEGISAGDHAAGLQSTLRNLAEFTEALG